MADWLRKHFAQPKINRKETTKAYTDYPTKDIYIQTFNNYCSTTANQSKLAYEPKAYLTQIRSANIRNMFTRFRIDANCTLDSSYRSFRYKSVEDSLCKICDVAQSVQHVLLHCKGSNLTRNRTIFEDKL